MSPLCDGELCEKAFQTTVTVYCPPEITSFYSTTSGVCEGSDTAIFDVNYILGDTNIVSWLWDFGDGTISLDTLPSTSHIYDTCNANSDFIASYYITDNNGCIDDSTINIEIFCAPEIGVTSDAESVCLGGYSAFIAVLTNPEFSFGFSVLLRNKLKIIMYEWLFEYSA